MGNTFEIWVWTYVGDNVIKEHSKYEKYDWHRYHATESEVEAFEKLKEVRALKTYGCVKLEIRE